MDAQFFIKTFHADDASTLPMYERLISYFQHSIKTGELKPGEQIITENEICDLLHISRTTVRQAMDHLVKDGLIHRQRGKGSFVTQTKLQRPINYLYNFTENMQELGVTAKSLVQRASVEIVNSFVRSKLDLPFSQEKVFHLTRVRCADDEPILLEDTYVPYYLCDGIEKEDFSSNSLYRVLKSKYELSLYHATETIEAIIISKGEAEILQCKPKIAGYRITRTSHLDTGYIFEYTSSVTRSDRCIFQMELYQNTQDALHKPIEFQRSVILNQ